MLKTLEKVDPAFRADVLNGLSEPIPAIPARWFYDRRGSELFDEITRLAELLSDPHRNRAARGAGSPRSRGCSPRDLRGGRIRRRAARPRPRSCSARRSRRPMCRSTFQRRLSARERRPGRSPNFPDIAVHPVEADFTKDVAASRRRSTDCPGSASSPARPSAISCRRARPTCFVISATILGTGAKLLIGMDRVKRRRPADRRL